ANLPPAPATVAVDCGSTRNVSAIGTKPLMSTSPRTPSDTATPGRSDDETPAPAPNASRSGSGGGATGSGLTLGAGLGGGGVGSASRALPRGGAGGMLNVAGVSSTPSII